MSAPGVRESSKSIEISKRVSAPIMRPVSVDARYQYWSNARLERGTWWLAGRQETRRYCQH